jgi:hypothetical protein
LRSTSGARNERSAQGARWQQVYDAHLFIAELDKQMSRTTERLHKLSELPTDWLQHPVIKGLIESYEQQLQENRQQVEALKQQWQPR